MNHHILRKLARGRRIEMNRKFIRRKITIVWTPIGWKGLPSL